MMRIRFVALITFVTLAVLGVAGQMVPANPVNTQQISMPVFTLNPAPASGASVQLSGNPGPQTIFYWVVAKYPIGNATLAGPFAITNAPNTLSGSNFVNIAPILPAGASSYDLLKTLTTIPPGGACACAVATAVAIGTVTNDQSNATGAYTVSTVNVNLLGLTLQNEVQSSGVSHLILRQFGVFVSDLSLVGTGGAPWPSITGGTNIIPAAHIEGSGSSMSTSGTGQIGANQAWSQQGLVAPSPSFALTGGSLSSGHGVSIQYTINTLAGETLPSVPTTGGNSSFGCSSGITCTLTVTAPTLPTGATYNVYAQDCASIPCTGTNALQAACTNIITNCVIGSVGAGAGVPTSNTAYLQPTPLLASECPVGIIPSWFIQDASGNWHTQAGVDPTNTGTSPPSPYGTLTICRRTWFNDSLVGAAPGKNAFINIYHVPGTGTNPAGQDRALHVQMSNTATDSATYFGWEGIQSEVDVLGTPAFTGGPDGEVAAGSFQLSLQNNTNIAYGTLGPMAVRAQAFRGGTNQAAACTFCLFGVRGIATNGNAATYASGFIVGISGETNNTSTGASIFGISLLGRAPLGTRLAGGNFGLYVENQGTNPVDWNISSNGANNSPSAGRNWFSGNSSVSNLLTTGAGTINVTGSFNAASYATTQITTPGGNGMALSQVGTPGSTSYSYRLVARDAAGGAIAYGAVGTTATGNATLDGSNFNRLTISPVNQTLGVTSYDVYRTASGGTPSSTGKIGNVAAQAGGSPGSAPNPQLTFDDTGLAGDGTTVPATNTTGGVNASFYRTATNCAASGSAANPSVVACSAAPAGTVYCDVAASAGTCTVNTTAVTANSEIHITPNAADGALLSKTCNAAPTVVPFAILAAKAPGVSFTINMPTLTVNGACFEYSVVN